MVSVITRADCTSSDSCSRFYVDRALLTIFCLKYKLLFRRIVQQGGDIKGIVKERTDCNQFLPVFITLELEMMLKRALEEQPLKSTRKCLWEW